MKRSKKRWAWTEAQKRKHHPFCKWNMNAPKWYCKTFHVKEKQKVQMELKKCKLGVDPDELNLYPRYNNRHIACWYWW